MVGFALESDIKVSDAHDGADDTDTQESGKVGATVSATEKLDFYGELAVQTNDGDVDNSLATKIGTKYSF